MSTWHARFVAGTDGVPVVAVTDRAGLVVDVVTACTDVLTMEPPNTHLVGGRSSFSGCGWSGQGRKDDPRAAEQRQAVQRGSLWGSDRILC